MKPIFGKELKLSRKGLLIWVIVMLITIGWGLAEYPMVSENIETVMQGMNMMPKVVRIMFGVEGVPLDAPLGYHVVMYFWSSLITFTHAAFVGVNILAKEERDKTSEYLFTKPYPRSTVITAKILVGVINVLAMTVTAWLGSIGTMLVAIDTWAPQMSMGFMLRIIATTMLGMFLTQLVFLAVGFLCAAFFKKYKTSLRASVFFLLTSYAIAVTIEYYGNIDYMNFLSPFRYFNAPSVVRDGISLFYVLIAVLITVASIYSTYVFYKKRDLLI